MTATRLYPYAFSSGIDLRIDAVEPGIAMDVASRYLRLWDEPASSWRLRVTASLAEDVAERVLPPSERTSPPVELLLRLRSTTSRRRELVRIPLPSEAGEAASLDLDLVESRWSGLIRAEALMVRTRDHVDPAPGFALEAGTIVASGPPVSIDVDMPATPPGGSLRIVWQDFATSTDPLLRRARSTLFALKASPGGEVPTLMLNSAIDHARTVLDTKGRTGWKARARDATYQTIVHQGWMSLIATALSELADEQQQNEDAGEEALESMLGGIKPWMQAVIRDWASDLWPEHSTDGALLATWDAVKAGNWDDLLVERAPTAIALRFKTERGLNGLVTEALQ